MIRNAFKAAGHWIRNSFTKNMGMKIGALVFAFLLWSYVVTSTNPIRTKTLPDVLVTYTGADELRQNELTSTVPLSEVLKTVTVTVQTKSENISLVTSDLLQATVDLKGITAPGEYTLPVKPTTNANFITITDTSPEEVTLNIEESVTKEVPVEVQLEGTKKDWLYYGTPILSQDTIAVAGARSNVEQVAKAICYVDIDGIEGSNKETRSVVLVDKDGATLASNLFSGSLSVIVEMPIYPKKTVAIDTARVKELISGVAEGYEILDVMVTPASVDIAGKLEDINAVSTVSLAPIVLDNATVSQTITGVEVTLPDGIYAAVPAEAEVQIVIQPQQDSKQYSAVDIGIKNLGENLEATMMPASVDIEVYGTAGVLAEFKAGEQLKPFVDLAGLAKGTHTVPIKFANQADLNVTIVPLVQEVEVTIK